MTILDALQGKNKGRAPVWLMRQAGRYLPEYRALRAKHSLKDLFFTKEHIVQVTKMPLDRFGVDAAILFSDITVVAEALGLSLTFSEGPQVTPQVVPSTVFSFIPEKLSPIFEAIAILKQTINVPLLGFCGAPFTVASYLVGGLDKALAWIQRDGEGFEQLLKQILQVTIWYVQMQEERGVDGVQIFDSWANALTPQEHARYSLPFVKRLASSIQVPSLFFMREVGSYIEQIPCGVSVDWTVSLVEARQKTSQVLQGNLDPEILFQPLDLIEKKTKEILDAMRGDPGFILNLGHGVKPNTPIEAVERFVSTARFGSY